MMTVSVIVPTHDRPHFLRQSLRSILWQRVVDLEVVVVDDGSPVGQVAGVVAEVADDRVRVLRNHIAQGVSAARNRGVHAAQGAWLAFCDDDVLAGDKLHEQLAVAEHRWQGWVYTGAVNVNASGRVVGGTLPLPPAQVVALLPQRNTVPGGGSGVLVHRKLLDRAGARPFDPELHNTEDWDLWVRLSQLEMPRYVPEPMVGYRVHTGGSSLATREILRGAEAIERRYGGPLDRVTLYRHCGRLCARAGRRGEALRWYIQTARLSADYRRNTLLQDGAELLGTRTRLFAQWLRLPDSAAPLDPVMAAYFAAGQEWLDRL